MKAYTVAMPNLPVIPNKNVMKFMKWIAELDGFIGIYPSYPNGTLVLFRTENHAKRARNKIKAYPNFQGGVGTNIGEVEMDWSEDND